MISKSARKSSRKASENRMNRRKKGSPTIYFVDKKPVLANRMAKRMEQAIKKNAPGLSTKQENRQKRKDRQKSARVVLRKIRRDTQRAMST